MSCQLIDETLALTRAARLAGGDRPLYYSEEVIPMKYEGYPLLSSDYDHGAVSPLSDEAWLNALSDIEPALVDFDWKGNRMILAGGSVSALAKPRDGFPSFIDFDIFLIRSEPQKVAISKNESGLPQEETPTLSIEQRVDALGQHLDRAWGGGLWIERTPKTVTFRKKGRSPVQVILCSYADTAEVLYSFDLGSSAVAWDGEHLWFSAMGRLAHAISANVLDLEARNASYEHRLAKYFLRGFGIVLPAADFSLAINGFKVYIGGLTFRVDGRSDTPGGLLLNYLSVETPEGQWESQYEYGFIPPYLLSLTNLRALKKASPVCNPFLRAGALYTPGRLLSTLRPNLSAEELLSNVNQAVKHNGRLNARVLTEIFGSEATAFFVIGLTGDAARADIIRTLLDAQITKYASSAVITEGYASTEGAASVYSAYPREPIPEAEWYGQWYRPAVEADTLRAEIARLEAQLALLGTGRT